MKKITVLDYGLGNIRSLKNSLKLISSNVSYFSENPKANFDILFIPGVGSFSKASEILFNKNFSNLILESNKNGILIVGICLGMHILLTKGYILMLLSMTFSYEFLAAIVFGLSIGHFFSPHENALLDGTLCFTHRHASQTSSQSSSRSVEIPRIMEEESSSATYPGTEKLLKCLMF